MKLTKKWKLQENCNSIILKQQGRLGSTGTPFLFDKMMLFKPRKTVVITIVVLFVIGLTFPFLIQAQSGDLRTREVVGVVVMSSFFSFAGFMGLRALKTVAFDQDYWTVSYYLFPSRNMSFHPGEITEIQRLDYVTYKPKIPVTTFNIRLNNSRKIAISSNEIKDFERLERILDKPVYRSLTKLK